MKTNLLNPFILRHNAIRSKQPELIGLVDVMLVMAFVTCVLVFVDERTIRGVSVWSKPLKFMVSTAFYAATTAWAMQFLPPSQQRTKTSLAIAWTVIATSLFEVLYITFQGAFGLASHYNASSVLYGLMFNLMAVAAVLLTGSQAALAWCLTKHTPAENRNVFMLALIIGLILTFVLGTASGFALGMKQAPAGNGLAIVGWHLSGGDYRPAHFLGVHAHQMIPLIGWILLKMNAPFAKTLLVTLTALYCCVWFFLMRV